MPSFDPTLPAANSPISSSELRGQFTSLKTLIDDRPTNIQLASAITSLTAGNPDGVASLNLTISNPPTQAEVQAIVNKFNELLVALIRAT